MRNSKRQQVVRFSMLTALLIMVGCSGSTQKNTIKERGDFVRLEYQDTTKTVDLGVGLWAWPMPIDFDEDGDIDLVVSCPDVPFKGTYFFENVNRVEAGHTIFNPPVRIGTGMRNLQISYVNDKPYVLGRGVEYPDFRKDIYDGEKVIYDSKSLESGHEKIRFSQWKYVDYENDGDLDLLVGIDDWGDYGWDNAFNEDGEWINGPLHGYVYLLENIDGTYTDRGKLMAAGKPMDLYGAPSPNMYDFDGDGDLDLICGEFLDRFTWFENVGSREKPIFSAGRFLSNEDGVIKMDLEMIIPSAIDWDKDGDVDLIVGDEDGRVALIEHTGKYDKGMPVFKNPYYLKQVAKYVKFGALATPYSVDWDDDGDEDFISGNSAGYIGFIENLDGGNPPKWEEPKRLKVEGVELRYQAGDSGSIQGPAEKKWGYTTLTVNDWDGDGIKDVIVNSIWGKVMWHKNIGKKGVPELSAAQPVIVEWPEGQVPKPEWNWWNPKDTELSTQWRTTPVTIDWNKDGLMDIVMLDHEGYLSFFERFSDDGILKLKPGQRIFYLVDNPENKAQPNAEVNDSVPLRLSERIAGGSGRRKWAFTDWDQDGDLDIVANNKPIAEWYENTGTKSGRVAFAFIGDLSEMQLAGHTTSPTMVDWDQDGVFGLVLGAEDGHFYYLNR